MLSGFTEGTIAYAGITGSIVYSCRHQSLGIAGDGLVPKFTPCGIATEFVGESRLNMEVITYGVLRGSVQLVFISPECIINNTRFRNMLHSKN